MMSKDCRMSCLGKAVNCHRPWTSQFPWLHTAQALLKQTRSYWKEIGWLTQWTKKLKPEKKSRNDRKLDNHPFCGRPAVRAVWRGLLRLCCRPGAVLLPPWESGSLTPASLPC